MSFSVMCYGIAHKMCEDVCAINPRGGPVNASTHDPAAAAGWFVCGLCLYRAFLNYCHVECCADAVSLVTMVPEVTTINMTSVALVRQVKSVKYSPKKAVRSAFTCCRSFTAQFVAIACLLLAPDCNISQTCW